MIVCSRGSLQALFLAMACCLPVAGWAQSPKRVWHAATGGFTVEAELVDIRDDKVQLKKDDGTTLWVPINKLSLGDVKYLQNELAKARDALRGKANGLEASAASDKSASSAADRADGDASKESESDADNAVPQPEDMSTTEGDVADQASAGGRTQRSPFAGMRDVQIVLGRASAHDVTVPQILSPWIAVNQRSSGKQAIQVTNIRTGKMFNPLPLDGFVAQIALSPDGSTLATFTPGSSSAIALTATATGKKIRDIPVPQGVPPKFEFISAQQLIVLESGMQGQATLYDVKTGKASRKFELVANFPRKLALTADGRWMAIPDNSTIGLYDLKAGKIKTQLAVVAMKGQGYSSIEDLAFCNEDTELAVLSGGTASQFQVFSMKTLKPAVQHVLSEPLRTFQRASGYLAPPIEYIPGKKAYILYGSAIIDREKGGPVWVEKLASGKQASPFRVMIDDVRQLQLTADFGSSRFEIVKLPWSEIAASKDLVSQGGTVADAGLPLVKTVAPAAARSVDANLNAKLFRGQKASADSNIRPQTIPIDRSLGGIASVRFTAMAAGKAVALPLPFGDQKKAALLIDLKKGEIEKRIDASFVSQIQDVSPNAQWLVATTGQSNDRVDVFDLRKGNHAAGFRPTADSSMHSTMAICRFVNDDVLVTTVAGSEAIAWELPELKARYRFSSLGAVYPFPHSGRFLHRGQQNFIVRRADDGSIEGLLESDSQPNEIPRSVHFRQDESACAALMGFDAQQTLVVWDLTSGKRTHKIALGGIAASRYLMGVDSRGRITPIETDSTASDGPIPAADSVTWAGENRLLVRWVSQDADRFSRDSNVSRVVVSLLDLDSGRVLWDYRMPAGIPLEGGPEGQLWFLESSVNQQLLVGQTMPSELALTNIAKAPAARLLVPPGEEVVLDVQVNISGDKLADGLLQEQVVGLVSKGLAEHQVSVSDRAALKLTIRVSQTNRSNAFGSRDAPRLLVSARLTDVSNNALWRRSQLVEVQSKESDQPVLAEQARRRLWDNALGWLKTTVDPGAIYESWYYRGLGESLVSSNGEKLIELRSK